MKNILKPACVGALLTVAAATSALADDTAVTSSEQQEVARWANVIIVEEADEPQYEPSLTIRVLRKIIHTTAAIMEKIDPDFGKEPEPNFISLGIRG